MVYEKGAEQVNGRLFLHPPLQGKVEESGSLDHAATPRFPSPLIEPYVPGLCNP